MNFNLSSNKFSLPKFMSLKLSFQQVSIYFTSTLNYALLHTNFHSTSTVLNLKFSRSLTLLVFCFYHQSVLRSCFSMEKLSELCWPLQLQLKIQESKNQNFFHRFYSTTQVTEMKVWSAFVSWLSMIIVIFRVRLNPFEDKIDIQFNVNKSYERELKLENIKDSF